MIKCFNQAYYSGDNHLEREALIQYISYALGKIIQMPIVRIISWENDLVISEKPSSG